MDYSERKMRGAAAEDNTGSASGVSGNPEENRRSENAEFAAESRNGKGAGAADEYREPAGTGTMRDVSDAHGGSAKAAADDGPFSDDSAGDRNRLGDMTIAAYTAALSSASPVPGGGGTAACAAALGAALGAMVGYLTVGKKKYAAVEEEMKTAITNLERLEKEFLGMMDRDAEAFAPLAAAYGLPRGTEEEKQEREIIMEQCLRAAAEAPLEVMRTSAETVSILENVARDGSRMAISDAGVGASLVKTAMQSAALNVFINTKAMKDRDRAREINTETREILEEYGKRADAVYAMVYDSLTEQ